MESALDRLSPKQLHDLAGLLHDGALSRALSLQPVAQVTGPLAADVLGYLAALQSQGFSLGHIGYLLEMMARERERAPDPALLFDLVLSGPDVPNTHVQDTTAVMQTLIQRARRNLLFVGYVVYQGGQIFERLASRMDDDPALQVTFCLDIQRARNDERQAEVLVREFATRFQLQQWPGRRLPDVYFDPRSLETGPQHSSLHAKCVIADCERALVTSANFTDAAQRRNIEVGLSVGYAPIAARLAGYFEGLIMHGGLQPVRFASAEA